MSSALIFGSYESFLSHIKFKKSYELSSEIEKSRYHCEDYDIYVYDARFIKLNDILKDLDISTPPHDNTYFNYIAILNVHIYMDNIRQLCNFIEKTWGWTKWYFTTSKNIEMLNSFSIKIKNLIKPIESYPAKYCKDEKALGWEYPYEPEWTEAKVEAKFDKLYLVNILDNLTSHLLKRDLVKGREIMEDWIKNDMKFELLLNAWNDYLCLKYKDKWHNIIDIFANFSQNITSNDGTYSYLHFNFDGLFIHLHSVISTK